ncbi:hypothetical protein V8E51_013883 [Hyaloscypha variabilis]
MGLNNVRSGYNLLTRAGGGIEIPSVIPEFGNLPLTIVSYNFGQDDLNQHISLLRNGKSDIWMHLSISPKGTGETGCARNISFGAADQPWKIPNIHVSRGLRKPHSSYNGGQPETPELVYVLVFQGQSGGLRSKLVLRSSLDLVGAEMFLMAANGFSVVFSGALLKKNLEKRGDVDYSFKSVNSLEELQAVDSDHLKKAIGILC